jgi:trimeric autotransporter adhesin
MRFLSKFFLLILLVVLPVYNVIAAEFNPEDSLVNIKSEPTGKIIAFYTGITTSTSITLYWVEEEGNVLADGYLIKGSEEGFDFIPLPMDGIPESDGPLIKNISYGNNECTFTDLLPRTLYYFKIFPYTNEGANINYKIQGKFHTYVNQSTE